MGEIEDSMTRDEYESWKSFYRLYPFDDFHRFHRPAALIASMQSVEKDAFEVATSILQPQPKRQLTPAEEAAQLMGFT